MKKTNTSNAQSQLKNALRQLHKMGLYDPKNPRKAPTRYAKTIVRKYEQLGVIGNKPRATVIKVPKSAIPNIAGEFKTANTKRGAAVIVPKRHGVKSYYSKKTGTIVQRSAGYKFERYPDRLVLMRGEFPKLRKGERLAIPVRSGFRILKDADAVLAEMNQYKPNDVNINFWQWPYIVTRM